MSTEPQAILIRVGDPLAQAYLQSFAFATGPDRAKNALAIAEVRRGLVLRAAAPSAEVKRLASREMDFDEVASRRVQDMARSLGIPEPRTANAMRDYGWKVRSLPSSARDVLSIGCGDGIELLFLRSVMPDARIKAIDWGNHLLPGLRDALDIDFLATNLVESLAEAAEPVDVIFSNHVLEHMYDPDRVLGNLARRLRPGGILVSALPMEGTADAPYANELRALARQPERMHAVDLVWVNPGHAWKTNPSDLRATILSSGFATCELLQRSDHISRSLACDAVHFERKQRRIQRVSDATFGLANALIKRVVPKPSHRLMKLWFAIDSRSRFGINPLKRDFAEEVLIVARRA